MSELAWPDVERLESRFATRRGADQLFYAVGSIGANLTGGYSRASSSDRARFYEHALGSARETRDWYWKARHVLGTGLVCDRMVPLNQIVGLLVTTVQAERKRHRRDL